MPYARRATIAALLATLSPALAFGGAINNRSTRWDSNGNEMGSSLSSSSERSGGGKVVPADDGEKKNNSDLSTQHSDGGGSGLANGWHSDHSNSMNLPSQQQHSYTPPTAPVKPLAHYIFLVHGYLGNDLEMGYLSNVFRRIICPDPGEGVDETINENEDSSGSIVQSTKRVKRSTSKGMQELLAQQRAAEAFEGGGEAQIVVHSVTCNVGKTHDGIRNGGIRLANEIMDYVRRDVQERFGDDEKDCANHRHVTYSIVGNSLGGLYARHAISLLPYQLRLRQQQYSSAINLHPNVFLTTATPHLGVSRHTYLPIPRVAEAVIGAGMGTTGRDLFRLNSEKDLASAAADNLEGGVIGGVNAAVGRMRWLSMSGDGVRGGGHTAGANADDTEDDMRCIIHNMCVEERYLTPLRNFRKRIAYANAYGTDFQVPTETAAFLNERSGVGHFVIASRYASGVRAGVEGTADSSESIRWTEEDFTVEERQRAARPFIVAVVRTDQTSPPQSHGDAGSDELIRMSQSLDALGWTKVFVDVRDRIPVPRLARPVWLRPAAGSLDDLVRERAGLWVCSLRQAPGAAANDGGAIETSQCMLTSRELARSTRSGDTLDFPMGHTVMIANAKSEGYSRINARGRPVMDGLAEDMVDDVLEFG